MRTLSYLLVALAFFAVGTASPAYEVIRTSAVMEVQAPPGYEMNQPSDVAIGETGNIYILDGVNDRVLAFGSSGNLMFILTHLGRELGNLDSPLGLNIDKEGRLLVADSANHRIAVFGRDGKFERVYDLPEENIPSDPTDVFSDLEHHYIADIGHVGKLPGTDRAIRHIARIAVPAQRNRSGPQGSRTDQRFLPWHSSGLRPQRRIHRGDRGRRRPGSSL